MERQPDGPPEDADGPAIPHRESGGATGTLEAAVEPSADRISRFLKVLGPGLITGASDDDPSGIGTFAVAGASLGFATLWTTWIMLPMMAAVQFSCAKIGMVSGRGLAGVLRQHYPRPLLYVAVFGLVIANTINAGADIGAIAAAVSLLAPISIPVLVAPIAAAILALQIFGSYRLISDVFKWLTLALLAYVVSTFFARPEAGQVLRHTFVPSVRLDSTFLATLVALLGTSISPYLFFWQASEEVEEEVSTGREWVSERRGATDSELKYAAWDTNIGMVVSQVVMYFIILATAATLHASGKTDVASA